MAENYELTGRGELAFSLGEARLVQGPAGEAGTSAYASAVAGGYTGTEEEFESTLGALPGYASDAALSAAGAADSALAAKSWTAGGTGTRSGEDTDNARYWASVARSVAGGNFATPEDVAEAAREAAASAVAAAGTYTDEKLAALPVPGAAGGVATLDGDGRVPASQLPVVQDPETVLLRGVTAAMPAPRAWTAAAWGGGRFVAVPSGSDKGAWSDDGLLWHEMSLPRSQEWAAVCYGSGQFLALASGSNKAAHSEDGVHWQETTLPAYAMGRLAWGGGRFVEVQGNGAAMWSENGTAWTTVTLPESASWAGLCYGGDRFLLVSKTAGKALWSSDGASWSTVSMPGGVTWSAVNYGGGRFVAVANGAAAAWSEDGTAWNTVTIPSKNWYRLQYGNGRFLASTLNGADLALSADGAVWHSAAMPSAAAWRFAFGGGRFAAAAKNSAQAVVSLDGADWRTAGTVLLRPDGGGCTFPAAEALGLDQLIGRLLTLEARVDALGGAG